MKKVEDIVKDHLLYLDAVHEFTDWLHSAKEELHRWSDTSGDTSAMKKKLAKINVRSIIYSGFLLIIPYMYTETGYKQKYCGTKRCSSLLYV